MRHNDPLFDLVKDTFQDFSPEAPATAYQGIQAKMKKKKGFWNFAYNSLNVYYVGAAIGAGLLAMTTVDNNTVSTAVPYEALQSPFVTVEKTQRVISTTEHVNETETEISGKELQNESLTHYASNRAVENASPEIPPTAPCDMKGTHPADTQLDSPELTTQLPAKTLPVTIQGYGLLKAKSILDQIALPGDEIVLTIPVHVEVEEE